MLDTSRLKYLLGDLLKVDNRSVDAFIVGEHGDSEFAVWSSANVAGVPMKDFFEMRDIKDHEKVMTEIADGVKNAAYEIINRKKATYYGIAMSVTRICEAIIRDEKSILPVSSIQHNNHGVDDVALSMPSIVGEGGLEAIVPIEISDEEKELLKNSADTLKSVIKEYL